MPAMLRVRPMTAEEYAKIEQLPQSQKESVRLVQRSRIIRLSSDGLYVSEIMAECDLSENSVRKWIKRFNEFGLAGLSDAPRSGRPMTCTPEQVSLVIESALTKPETLGLPFACWTLDRLEAYLNEQKHIGMKRSRIDELLIREGLRWKMQEAWFSEQVDPEFAEKREPSSRSTRGHPRVVS